MNKLFSNKEKYHIISIHHDHIYQVYRAIYTYVLKETYNGFEIIAKENINKNAGPLVEDKESVYNMYDIVITGQKVVLIYHPDKIEIPINFVNETIVYRNKANLTFMNKILIKVKEINNLKKITKLKTSSIDINKNL